MAAHRTMAHCDWSWHGFIAAADAVTTKIEAPWKRAGLVVKQVVTARERQLDCLWREGLRPRALANLEGDSTQ